ALLQFEHDERGTEAPVLVAEFVAGVGRQLHHGTHTPDQPMRLTWRKKCGEHGVADAAGATDRRAQRRLPDYRHDGAGDDVPVLVDLDRAHRRGCQDVMW